MISLKKYDDLTLFKKDAIPFLEKHEAENNLVLGVLQTLSEKDEIPLLMATVQKGNEIAVVLLQTLPSQIILSKSTPLTSNEIYLIGESLINEIQDIPGLLGERMITSELAMFISKVRGIQSSIVMDQKIYKVEKVKYETNTNGKLRTVLEKDHQKIKEWVYQFCYETKQPISLEEADHKTKIMINKGNLVAWDVNNALVSMAYATRPTRNNITI